MTAKQWLRNLLFPPKCVVCEKVLPISTALPYLCPSCAEKPDRVPYRICKTCGKILDIAADRPYCTYCAKDKYPFSLFVAPFYNIGEIQHAIRRMKFCNRFSYADTFACLLCERIQSIPDFPDIDVIVPAPISKKRLKQRGYNQTELIASKMAALLSVPSMPLLVKIKETPPQSTLSAKERTKNLEGSMEVLPLPDGMQTALFLDDIYTTGSTTAYCVKLLKKAGFRKVVASAIAIAPPFWEEEQFVMQKEEWEDSF